MEVFRVVPERRNGRDDDDDDGDARKIKEIESNLRETVSINVESLKGLATRGQRLRNLLFSSSILSDSVDTFRKRSAQLNQENFCFRFKVTIAALLCAFSLLLFTSYLTQGWIVTKTTTTTTPPSVDNTPL